MQAPVVCNSGRRCFPVPAPACRQAAGLRAGSPGCGACVLHHSGRCLTVPVPSFVPILSSPRRSAGIEEDSEHKFRDGISMVPILRGDPAVLADPRRHRVAYLIEKPAASGGVDT